MQKNPRIIALLLVTLFAISMASAIPASANTITGKHTLWRVTEYVLNDDGSIYISAGNFTYADEFTYLIRTKINSIENGSLIAVNVTGQTITGAQVWLWLSESGGANIEENDTFYAGPFELLYVTAMNDTYYQKYVDPASGQTFWVGNNLIVGPVPTALAVPKGVEYYIKMTDVAPTPDPTDIQSSDVAVSENKWRPYESLVIQPSEGPAGILVTATGMAWDPSKLVNLTWSTEANTTVGTVVSGLISPTMDGQFSITFYAPDEKWTNASDASMWVNAYYNGTTWVNDWKMFTEMGREWLQVKVLAPTNQGSTWSTGASVSIFEDIYVSGNYFNPRSDVTLYWDWGTTNQQILTTTSVNGTGFFNTTVSIPISDMGSHMITAVDYSFHFNATVTVIPTLVLDPTEGPIATVVTATGYGFPNNDTKANVTIWWDFTCWCEDCPPIELNLTATQTDPNGHFEVTFVVPATVGGIHDVWATDDYSFTTAYATFKVLPTITLTPITAANNGTKVTAIITGLASWSSMGEDEFYYDLCIDYEKDFEFIMANCSGILKFEFFVTAGMEPGIHVVAIYEHDMYGQLTMIDHAFFTATTEADPEVIMKLDEILAALDDIAENIEDIDFSTIQDAIADAQADVLSAISDVETLAEDAVSAAEEASTSAGDAADSASDALTAAQGTQSTVSGMSTAVYATIVLALIAALASIIAVITLQRKVA
jgi:hypothetical protein